MASESLTLLGAAFPPAQVYLVWPLALALWMAWIDLKTNRIPNYLTLGCALAGLGHQLWNRGWPGLVDGFCGIGLGLALLIFFYLRQGLGAGDVKALAALGAWLGPGQTLHLFVYMAFSGVLVIVGFLWWRGLLLVKMRQFYGSLVNFILLGSSLCRPRSEKAAPPPPGERLPYALALALGLAGLCWQKFTG